MFTDSAARTAPVAIAQTARGQFTGWIRDETETIVFGPYTELDELVAVMSDWLARAVREAKLNIKRLAE